MVLYSRLDLVSDDSPDMIKTFSVFAEQQPVSFNCVKIFFQSIFATRTLKIRDFLPQERLRFNNSLAIINSRDFFKAAEAAMIWLEA